MEIHVVIDDGDLSPGDYLTGTVYLHLTSYLPPPPPTIPTHLADDDDTEPSAHRTLLEAERHRLLHPSSPTPAVLERTELLDALQLQVMGKVLPDASKIPKAVISSFQPVAPGQATHSTAEMEKLSMMTCCAAHSECMYSSSMWLCCAVL